MTNFNYESELAIVKALKTQLAEACNERDRLRNILDSGKGQSGISMLYGIIEKLECGITAAVTHLETIVCTVEPDDGVVLLSNDSPTHIDPAGQIMYDHAHFSPLGDALIELHKMLTKLSFKEQKGGVMKWISVSEKVPTHNYTVVIWVTGGPLHFGEDYLDVGAYIDGQWKSATKCLDGTVDDEVVQVSHWFTARKP
jgi:hypothetical protein